jgi:hypothetical protein
VVERDALYRDGQAGGRRRTLIEPGTVDDPHGREVIGRLVAAGMVRAQRLLTPHEVDSHQTIEV